MSSTFISTRGGGGSVSLETALFRGLAPDGGLFLPESLPHFAPDLLEAMPAMSYAAIAAALSALLLGDTLSQDEYRDVVEDAFSFPVPMVPLEDDLFVLELFHGPTLAFKDFGARFMARLMVRLRRRVRPGPVTVLVATSGDTGGAVASAFHDLEGIRVLILYPEGRVSPRQERQITTLGGNVEAVAVRGSFDDCQRLVKGAFADPDLVESIGLTSANSINVGRLLPQCFYYAWAWSRLAAEDPTARPVFVTPSGNFGNLAAGILALRMGVPISGFVAATNRNRVVPDYLVSGSFRPKPSLTTPSSAMDVGDPSNLERIQSLFQGDLEELRNWVEGSAHGDDETLTAIGAARDRWGYVADPHTAVGLLAIGSARRRWPGTPIVVLSTAHPAKFPQAMEAALGTEPEIPSTLARAMESRPHAVTIPSDAQALQALLAR